MPINRVASKNALNKREFHQQLRHWFQTTGEQLVGAEGVDGRTSWVHVRDGADLFVLHADTSRKTVEDYLHAVTAHGDNLLWNIVPSQRGKMTAIAFGPKKLRITSFYLYAARTA